MSKDWIVAVLSTAYDLSAVRKNVIDLLDNFGFKPSAFETPEFPVDPNLHSHDACLVALGRVDISIVIIDKRYGGFYVNDRNISITEKEYLQSQKDNKIIIPCISKYAWDEKYKYDDELKRSGMTKSEFDKTYKCNYVQHTKVFDFIEKVKRSLTDNYIIFFESSPDLLSHLEGRLKGLTRYYCQKIVEKQMNSVGDRITSTGFSKSLLNIIRDGYFVEPPFSIVSGYTRRHKSISNLVNTQIKNGKSIALIGEPGQGKTTILAKCFLEHGKKAIHDKSWLLPFYLALKGKNISYHFNVKKYFSESFDEYLSKKPYPLLDLKNGIQPVFYIDAFDELSEQFTLPQVNKLFKADIFKYPFLITARKRFAERFLSNVHFTNLCSIIVELLKWDKNNALQYIDNFTKLPWGKNLRSIDFSHGRYSQLLSAMDNPLIATLILVSIHDINFDIAKCSSVNELFKHSLLAFAQREIDRLSLQEISSLDLYELWMCCAWAIYKYRKSRTKLTFKNLAQELKEIGFIDNLIDASAIDSLFSINSKTNVVEGALHEQFIEFLIANMMFMCSMASGDSSLHFKAMGFDFLEHVLNPEVNRYFRSFYDEAEDNDKNTILDNIWTTYLSNLRGENKENILIRNHAMYHLTRLINQNTLSTIERSLLIETNTFVILSIYFGAVKSGYHQYEQIFSDKLKSDSSLSEANIGYHLTYYSDINNTGQFPFEDDLKSEWRGTLDAFRRHFKAPERYYYLRRIEIITLQHIISKRKSNGPLSPVIFKELEDCIHCSQYDDNNDYYAAIQNEFKIFKQYYEKFQLTNKNTS